MKHAVSVLVIDDDLDAREILRDSFLHCGFAVSVAGSAREALQVLQNGPPPDAIILDLMMPRSDGHWFLAQCRTKLPHLDPIVVVLSSAAASDISTPADVHDRFLKPPNLLRLIARIRELVESRGLPRRIDERAVHS